MAQLWVRSLTNETSPDNCLITNCSKLRTFKGCHIQCSDLCYNILQLAWVILHFFYLHTDGLDYTAVSENLVFNAAVSSQMVTIPILGDFIVEHSEMFTLALTSDDPAVIFNPSSSNVTIEDVYSEYNLTSL